MKRRKSWIKIVGLFALVAIMLSSSIALAADLLWDKHTIDSNFNGAWCVYATDIDGDTDIDVVASSTNIDDIVWYENDGSENFTKHVIDPTFSWAYSVYATDVDGDNDVDVLAAGWNVDYITWWENDGSENFTRHTLPGIFSSACSVYATDVDGDSDVDILGANGGNQQIAWWENDGSENFTKHIISHPVGSHAYSVYATDVDGDLDIDILAAAQTQILWWENDGSENFTKRTVDSSFSGAWGVYATDIDGDTDIDVLGAGATWTDTTIAWWENTGGSPLTWSRHNIAAGADFGWAYSVYAADLDGDSDIDVLGAAGGSDEIAWWENDGSENFTMHSMDSLWAPACVYATDVDGDGDVDVLGTAGGDDEVNWYENLGPPEPDIRTPIDPIDFGDVAIDGSQEGTTTLYNDGTDTLTINTITRTSGGTEFTYDEIAYDDGVANGYGAWTEGGSRRAVKFSPPSYPVDLETARVYFQPDYPDSDHEEFTVEVWDDDGAGGAPGTLLGSVNTTATSWNWWDVDISGLGITITSGDFYIAYLQLTDQPDCEALCFDTTDPIDGRSWTKYKTNPWEPVSPARDHMIRCVVDLYTGPPTPFDIGPGESQAITLFFAPTSEGSKSAIFNVNSNDPDTPDVTFDVSGNGVLIVAEAVTEFILNIDDDDASGGLVSITEVRDLDTGQPLAVLIGEYTAEFSYDGSVLNVLDVRHKSPFTGSSTINNTTGITTFSGSATGGVPAPVDLAFLTMRLVGSVDDQCVGTLTFTSIVDDGGSPLGVSPEISYTFRRGDARADGAINMADAMFIAQYLVGLRDLGDGLDKVHAVNAASVKHDNSFDVINMADAMFIAQYLVGLRDGNMNPIP